MFNRLFKIINTKSEIIILILILTTSYLFYKINRYDFFTVGGQVDPGTSIIAFPPRTTISNLTPQPQRIPIASTPVLERGDCQCKYGAENGMCYLSSIHMGRSQNPDMITGCNRMMNSNQCISNEFCKWV